MNAPRTVGKLAAVIGAALMSGCYSYTPVERPSPGTFVRIEVPVRSALDGGRRREQETASMEGMLLTAGDSLILQIESLQQIGNFREIHSIDTLRIARTAVSEVSTRAFSKPKTIALSVIIVGATIGLAAAAFGVGGGSQGGDHNGGGTTPSIVLKPIFSALIHALGR